MKKKSVRLLITVLTGITALIWTVACVLDCIYRNQFGLFMLRVVCALAWYGAFFVNLRRYRACGNEE